VIRTCHGKMDSKPKNVPPVQQPTHLSYKKVIGTAAIV